jgi:hypothetical protein
VEGGVICRYAPGATAVFEGERLNYHCTDGAWIYGLPTQGRPWTVAKAQFRFDAGAPTPIETPETATVVKAWF